MSSISDSIRKSFAFDIYSGGPVGDDVKTNGIDVIREALIAKLGEDAGNKLWYSFSEAVSDAIMRGSDYVHDALHFAEKLQLDAAGIEKDGRNSQFGWTGGISHEGAGAEDRRAKFVAARHRAHVLEAVIQEILA